MKTPVLATERFWQNFANQSWEKRPIVFREAFTEKITNTNEIFEGLVYAGERARSRAIPNPNDIRFYIDNSQVLENNAYLPSPSDASVWDYAERLDKMLEGQPYTLIINSFQLFSEKLWLQLRSFLRGMYGALGSIPAGAVDAHIIVANYGVSPFKLHKDPNAVFTFVVEGRKTMLVWPFKTFQSETPDPEAIHKQVDLHGVDYEPFRDQAIALAGEAGDVLYWPSSYWHAGESDLSKLHITLHLSCHLNAQPFRWIVNTAEKMVEQQLALEGWQESYPFDVNNLRQSAQQIPTAIQTALHTFTALTQQLPLEQALKVKWLNRATGLGFEMFPFQREPLVLSRNQFIQCDPLYPIVWLIEPEQKLLCSVNGQTFITTAHPQLIKLLDLLNTGEKMMVSTLMQEFYGTEIVDDVEFNLTPEQVLMVLQKLYSLRAFTTP